MSPKRILIVEDEYTNAETLAWVLRDEGFTVSVAGNGRRGLELVDAAPPDLIVTDYMMPIMNGIQMANAIRSDARYRDIPILMMSGVSERALSAHRSAIDGFLRKPFDLEALLDAVTTLLAAARGADGQR